MQSISRAFYTGSMDESTKNQRMKSCETRLNVRIKSVGCSLLGLRISGHTYHKVEMVHGAMVGVRHGRVFELRLTPEVGDFLRR